MGGGPVMKKDARGTGPVAVVPWNQTHSHAKLGGKKSWEKGGGGGNKLWGYERKNT